MISYIRGTLAEIAGDRIVVEAGHFGMDIFVPVSVLGELPGLGTEILIYTHFQVKEDAMTLYGFLNRRDLEMFRLLISVNGIGPKGALGILSALRPDDLRLAVISGDAKAISRAPGVGSKTAQRVILDLKDKISMEELMPETFLSGGDLVQISDTGAADSEKEAVAALAALGYSVSDAARAVRKVPDAKDMETEDVLKAALKYLL